MKKQLNQFVERASEVVGAYGNFQTAPENVNAETIAAGRCELIRQVMENFIRWCYHRNEAGLLVNLQGNSVIPSGAYVPWGAGGKQRGTTGKTQLTRGEREVTRQWLAILRKDRNGRKSPFFYDASTRRWCLDIVRYPTEQSALQWLAANLVTPADYVAIVQALRQAVRRGEQGSSK